MPAPKYVFMAGAPGSKWSSVAKNIYYSPSIDRSDYSDARTYYHSAWGEPELMHLGAYFDPGMEFGKDFIRFDKLTKAEAEAEFDRPFEIEGRTRIIKSHVFCHHLDRLKEWWPDCPIVLVHRTNDACLGWWVRCREFRITYPDYQYYSNLDMMGYHINAQNKDMLDFATRHGTTFNVIDNVDLTARLGIELPPVGYRQNYRESDIRVGVA